MKKIAMVLLACISIGSAKNLGGYGSTYQIAEPSLLDTIQQTLKAKQDNGEYADFKKKFQAKVRESVLQPKPVDSLKTTDKPELHQYKSAYTLSHDIKDGRGFVIYPRGTSFNPLDSKSLPKSVKSYYQGVHYDKELIFFDARDIKQLNFTDQLIKKLDDQSQEYKLIMTGGNIKDTSEYLNAQVYFDQGGKLSQQLRIQHVPTVVSQNNDHFDLQEYSVQRFSNKLKESANEN